LGAEGPRTPNCVGARRGPPGLSCSRPAHGIARKGLRRAGTTTGGEAAHALVNPQPLDRKSTDRSRPQMTHNPAALGPWARAPGKMSSVEPLVAVRLVGAGGVSGLGRHLSLRGLLRLANGVRSVGLAAPAVAGDLVGQPVEPVGTTDDWAGVPSPWRMKAFRSDGQPVLCTSRLHPPSSAL
jgi:hypothetical protein